MHAKAAMLAAMSLALGLGCLGAKTPGADAADGAAPVAAPPRPRPAGPRLGAADVTLPLVFVKGFPFVEGAIDGHAGKLLFDIGALDALTVDSHTVTLPGAVPTGRGFFGSGQTFDVVRYPVVTELTLPAGLRYRDMRNIRGHPGLPLEQDITPDFIGWLGVDFFDDHLLKLDYAASSARFVRNDATGEAARRLAAGSGVMHTVSLGDRAHPNLPTLAMSARGVPILGGLDTGTHTTIWLTDAQQRDLEAAGALQVAASGAARLSGVAVQGFALAPTAVEITRGAPPFAKRLPRQDLPFISLGYEFFSRYLTIWDFQRGTLSFGGR